MATPDTDTPDVDLPAGESQEAEKPKLNLDVKVDERGACERHVTVTIPREDVDRYFSEALDELAPKAEVPGFRPGRAPRKLVESRFREQMGDQVKSSLVMDSVTQISEEGDFSAISEPNFDFEAIELPKDGPLTFEFDIEVRPEFEIPEWRGLQLKRLAHEYTDEEVDEHLKRLLSRYGREVEKVGPIEEGDVAVLSMEFRDGDEVVARIDEKTVPVKSVLSFPDAELEGFADLLKGAAAGETRSAKITVSSDAQDEALRGKELDVDFHIDSVNTVELPELTATFLDTIGRFEDEEDLRLAVREELERQFEYHQQRRIRQQITAALTAGADWDLPPELLRRQGRRELERAVLELRSSGFSDDVIQAHQNELRRNSLESTARALKEHFIFERIAEDRDIEADPQDYDAEVRSIARQSQDSPRRVRARLEKRGQMDALRNQIIERKVIDLITSEAEFTDEPFEPSQDDTAAVNVAICAESDEENIPEAKYGQEAAEKRPGQS